MQLKKERNRVAILNALKRHGAPMTSTDLATALEDSGCDLSERSLRLYLSELDAQGLTRPHGRRGRSLTESGLLEVRAAQTLERVGYLSAKIDAMTYRMSFDLPTCSGQVVVNVSLIPPERLMGCVDRVMRVFEAGYAMGNRLGILAPGEQIGSLTIPSDRIGFCSVCSITINGVLLKHGVPTTSRFGGLLELRDRTPVRFVEMIHYDGTSIDPLEVFIRSGMTDYHGAIRDGNGLIGASFREMPSDGRDLVLQIGERLQAIGLGAFMRIGYPAQPVLGLPVSEGRIGAVIVGGLNPIAILEESSYRVDSRAMAGLLDYHRLFPYGELPTRLREFL
jgi:repressor of nif and glnA expression